MAELQEIDIPGVGPVDFPSDMPDEEIMRHVYSNYPHLSPDQKNAPRETEIQQPIPQEDVNQPGVLERLAQSQKPIIQAGQSFAEPVSQGLKRFGAGVGQLAYPLIDKVIPGGGGLTGALERESAIDESVFEQKYGDNIGAQGLALGAEIAPSLVGFAGLQAARAPKMLMDVVKNAPAAVKALTAAGGIFAKNAGLAATYAPITYDPTFERTGISGGLQKAIEAAPVGGVVGTALAGLGRVPQIPAQMLARMSPFKERQAKQMVDAVEGTATGLGDTIHSPALKMMQENFINKVPFSGASKTQIDTVNKINERGLNILDNLYPGNITRGDAGALLKSRLIEASDAADVIKRQKYAGVDLIADKNKVFIDPQDYSKTASKIIEEIKSSKKAFASPDEDAKSRLLKYLEKSRESVGGRLKDANITRSELREEAQKAKLSGNTYLQGVYGKMSTSLGKDIERVIQSPATPKEVKRSFDNAQKYYAENIVPFQEKEITKFTKKDEDSDLLVNYFIRGGKTPRANILKKLVSKLGGDDKNILAKGYLSDSLVKGDYGRYLDVKKLIRDYNNINSKQQSLIFPDKNVREEFKKLSTLVKANADPLNAMVNQPTGKRSLDALVPFAIASAVLGGGAYADKPMESAGLLGISSLLARRGNKFLTSQKARDMFLKGFKPMQQPGIAASGLSGLGAVGATLPER